MRAASAGTRVASVCIEEIRVGVRAQARLHATAAAMSLYRSWARAETAVASLDRVHGGGASADFARDALRASHRAGTRAVAELLATFRDVAAALEGGSAKIP